jgi:hypothetical protein
MPILPSSFTFVAPAVVLAVIPGTGPTTGGQTVTIIGNGFAYGATVAFGANPATSVAVNDINTITCVTPAGGAGAVSVSVTNVNVISAVGTLANAYTYAVIAPTVTAIRANAGAAAGGESVIITGSAFVATPTVLFGGSSATSVVFIDANHISCITPAHAQAVVDVTVTNPDAQIGILYSGYTYTTVSPWTTTGGWWWSNEGFAGGAQITTATGAPALPRTWAHLSSFATGGAAMLGGSPAASVIFRNHIIYAADDYTTGVTQPKIRIFDGTSDRVMGLIPNTLAGVVPKAILSMLLVDGIIYLTTLDSGTTSTDFAGRVFSFDPLSQTLAIVGAGFGTGEVPYALAWHMDRLWVGTNAGDATKGKIYFFRPNIDIAWTTDYTLSTSSVGGATSLQSYKGKLYVGTDNAAGSFAKVLVRDTAGAYTTSETASGGTAKVNNGFLNMIVFKNNLYATYWNPDTTAVATIFKYDGTTWTTPYTGAALTLRPFITQFLANQYLYTVGGGDGLRASLIRTANGTSWDELTAYLAGPITETALPIYGAVNT